MSKTGIEALVTTCFSRCPFCLAESPMRFEWGHSIPNRMSCSNCRAEWELLFGLNGDWRFLGAKLMDTGSTNEGNDLKGKMYDAEFWENRVVGRMSKQPQLPTDRVQTERIGGAERMVIIREIVKIRCPYCGVLYDEIKSKCPNCGGKR